MNLKKALALLLALTLCLGMFAACAAKTEAPAEDGSTSQPAADAAPAEESQSNVTPVGEYPIVKEPITFKVMGRKDSGAPDWSELEVFQRLSEITNINFDFEIYDSST